MSRLFLLLTAAASLALLVPVAPLSAECGPNHMNVVGTVSGQPASPWFSVKRSHASGKKAVVRVWIWEKTRYIRSDRSEGSFADLTPNSSVQVSGSRAADGSVRAEKILITSPAS